MDRLRYSKPAKDWFSALPIGNGKTGVMLTGGKKVEKMYINDGTLWSGSPNEQLNPEAKDNLGKVRELIFAGKNVEAERLAEKTLGGLFSEIYLPVGEVDIEFKTKCRGKYERSLDLENAVCKTKFGDIERESFASHPDGLVAYRATSATPFDCFVSATSIQPEHKVEIEDNKLFLVGHAPDTALPNYEKTNHRHDYSKKVGMGFGMEIKVVADGAVSLSNGGISVKKANKVSIFLTTETGFVNSFTLPERDTDVLKKRCDDRLTDIPSYAELLSAHIADYQKLFFAQNLVIESGKKERDVIKSLRRARFGKPSPHLINLYYNYGKYLTIACSRSGGKASGLQGLWSYTMNPPWCAGYTVNINTEMNYWHASECGLGDSLAPFVEFVHDLIPFGKHTAETNFGASGFCVNHNVDIWAKTTPTIRQMCYMYSPLCGVWLTNELYYHYRCGLIDEYADKVYECVEESARFLCDYMVKHDGVYTICPSVSPELSFKTKDGVAAIDYGSAFELGLSRCLLSSYLEIGRDKGLRSRVSEILNNMQPFTFGETGINEWHKYFPVTDKGHRHFSPLYTVYPARSVEMYRDKELFDGAKKLFDYRLDHSKGNVGWSGGWAMCLAAKFRDTARFSSVLTNMLKKATFDNLFDRHPPKYFQIDGNFGFVAGVNEALMTTDGDVAVFLPACPDNWTSGKMSGLRSSYAVVDFEWKDGKVCKLKILSGKLRIRDVNLTDEVREEYKDILVS